jgi:hypothetical protein
MGSQSLIEAVSSSRRVDGRKTRYLCNLSSTVACTLGISRFSREGSILVDEYEPLPSASKYIPSRSGLLPASKEALPEHNNRRISFADVRFIAASRLSRR